MAKKIPPTRFPDAAAVSYYKAIKKMVDEYGRETLSAFDKSIAKEISRYQQGDSQLWVSDGVLDIVSRVIGFIRNLGLSIFQQRRVETTAKNFIEHVNLLNKVNITRQGKLAGVAIPEREGWLDEFMRSSISENVSYITNIRDEYTKSIESIIYQGVKNGRSSKEIRSQLVERIGMTNKRATFIAIDQAGSVFGQMTGKRHESMGVERFRWSTSKDERVRDSHRILSDKVFEYKNPPAVGLPGTDYRCRCVAIPIFDEEEVNDNGQ